MGPENRSGRKNKNSQKTNPSTFTQDKPIIPDFPTTTLTTQHFIPSLRLLFFLLVTTMLSVALRTFVEQSIGQENLWPTCDDSTHCRRRRPLCGVAFQET